MSKCEEFGRALSHRQDRFASGKPTSLVIDVGASSTSVTPVYDGLMLKKGSVHSRSPHLQLSLLTIGLGMMHSRLAGNFVSDQVRLAFSQAQPPVPLTPHYMVATKTPVDAGQPSQATYRSFATPPHESFRRLQEERVITEFKESCVRVWNPNRNVGQSLTASAEWLKNPGEGLPFEFPDGWNNVFHAQDRYRPAEGLFDAKGAVQGPDHSAPSQDQTIPALCKAAVNSIDTDVKGQLLANIVVTGSTSLMHELLDRVNFELQSMYPGPKVRLSAPGNMIERKFASWIGGSILASLGTFHQMWVSKKEYEEHGPGIVEKRCK